MRWISVSEGRYSLGWRHELPEAARAGVDGFLPRAAFLEAFSPRREVALDAFEIQSHPYAVEPLLDDLDDAELDAIMTLPALCDAVDAVLARRGWRLPTEDELEAALGGSLFTWGDEIPEGTPYEPGHFDQHEERTPTGLFMPSDTYQIELVRSAFKMGDGGAAVCGGYPWPVAWLTLSPSARVPPVLLDDLFVWVENAVMHPVRQ